MLAGQEIYFVLYVDNVTDYPVGDIDITDQLDESAFTYIPGSLETATAPTGADDATLWAATWQPATDQTGGPDDTASAIDTGRAPGPDRITAGPAPGQFEISSPATQNGRSATKRGGPSMGSSWS